MKNKALRILICFTLISAISFITFVPVSAQAKKGLPLGLAKRDELPPGLAKRQKLPPGLQKRLDKLKKENPRDEPMEEEAVEEKVVDEKQEKPAKKTVDNEPTKMEDEKTIIEVQEKPAYKEESTEVKDKQDKEISIKKPNKVKDKKLDKTEELLYLKLQNVYESLLNSFNDLLKLLDQLS